MRVALQETFLKSCPTTKIRRYGCVRKDTEGPSVSGGVCIFTPLDVPSSALPLHTSLQAVAVRIHSTSLITVCCFYLPPNTVIHQHDLNNLVDQLPAPFVILGDFNGHSTLVWKEHCFPSSCREAIVIPILKPIKVAKDALSYRPIALTSCFCKTFERMVNTRLVYLLEKEKCISPLHSGFRKGRSTPDNLVFLESQIRDAFVRRNHLVSLFFDVEKAYDRTWRYGILLNMHDFGLKGNLPIFIFTFLAVRYFHHSSSHKFIQDQGVPQGSVLSVTLFNIHMSRILGHLQLSGQGMLYVDDLQVSRQGSDMRLIERQLQTTANRLVKWCDQNGRTIYSLIIFMYALVIHLINSYKIRVFLRVAFLALPFLIFI
ncbi:probable RNA-directed DNA polymerase from transposon X-element [Trichonephila clavipes]|nr:probable RNA-directed DNA polymerase from transposon X-element [Trichonephila clavipes]